MQTPSISTPLNAAFVLFGMGGMGGRCIARFAEMCSVNPIFGKEMLSRTHFVLIDTDVGDLNKTAARIKTASGRLPGLKAPPVEKLAIGADIDSFQSVVLRDQRSFGWSGLDENSPLFDAVWTAKDKNGNRGAFTAPRAPGRPSEGASQCPMISSYLAMRSVARFDEKMNQIQSRIQTQSEGANARLVIVTSLAGGTGRGSWWLAATRARLRLPGVREMMGVFLDSSCFEQVLKNETDRAIPLRMHTNSLTGFGELAMWLRLGMFATEHQQAAEAPDFFFPSLDRPTDPSPRLAILDTRLLANPAMVSAEDAAGYAARYPLRRAFVVTGETDGAPLEATDAAAGLLVGLCGLNKTASVFSNKTDWAGSGMTSVASIPLSELKQGFDLRLRAGVIEDTLLASHEASQVESDLLHDLRRVIDIPPALDFETYESFARRFLDRGGRFGGSATDSGLLTRAIRRIFEKSAPIQGLSSSLEEQLPPDEIGVSDSLFAASSEATSDAYRSALAEWMQDEVRAFRGTEPEDGDAPVGGDLRLEDWFFEQALARCRHGDGDRLFSLRALESSLNACVKALSGAKDRAQKMVRELNAAAKAGSGSQGAGAGRRGEFRGLLEAAAGRNPLWPMWPSVRYSEEETSDLVSRARFEFVRANLAGLLNQHVRRLEILGRDLGRAEARVREANGVLKGIVDEHHDQATPLLGFDSDGRLVSQSGACRIVPADETARWGWLADRLAELQPQRKSRCLTLPVLLKDKDELVRKDAFQNAARTVRPIVSQLAFEYISRLGFRPLADDQAGGLVTAEEREQEELRNFAQGVRNRLGGLSISGGDPRAEASFDKAFALERVLRSWASEIATISKEPMGLAIREPADRNCRAIFGFGLDQADKLVRVENRGALVYCLAARIADDNDEPIRALPMGDGKSMQDKVSILVPGDLLEAVRNAADDKSEDEESARSREYQRSVKYIESIGSEHLLFASTWTFIPNDEFRSGGWDVWNAFHKHETIPDLRSNYLTHVEDPEGGSVFNAPEGAVGLGYTCPIFIRRPQFAKELWRPWVQGVALPKQHRKSFAILYAMLGVGEGVDRAGASATAVDRFLEDLAKLRLSEENPDLHWTMPILSYEASGEGERANQLRFRLERAPFEAIVSQGNVDFRLPNAARQAAIRKAIGNGGPVEFVRDLNSGELDGLVEGIHSEHSVLMKLIKRRPQVEELVTDPLRRAIAGYLRDMIEMRKTRVGKSNEQTRQLQMEFYDGLLGLLKNLEQSGRSLLDPYVGA
jgi:hypothetical protein